MLSLKIFFLKLKKLRQSKICNHETINRNNNLIFFFIMRAAFILAFFPVTFACVLDARAEVTLDTPNPAEALKQRDLPEAARQAKRLAETGDPEGQLMHALFHWHGIAQPQNFQEALNWVTLSAVTGNRRALNARLAMLKSVEPTISKKSMEWARGRLTKLAEAGDNFALVRMANSYSPMLGFENAIEAYFWFSLSVSSGEASARRQRDKLLTSLTQADIIKTQERARVWFDRWRSEIQPESTISNSMDGKAEEYSSKAEPSQQAILDGADTEHRHDIPGQIIQGGSIE